MLSNFTDWNTIVVGQITHKSSLLCESDVPDIRFNNEESLKQELAYAGHLGLPAILVSLTTSRCVNLARIINNKVTQGVCYQVSGNI